MATHLFSFLFLISVLAIPASRAFAKDADDVGLRASLQQEFTQLQLQGETKLCADSNPLLQQRAKVLSFEEELEMTTVPATGTQTCAMLTLKPTPPKEIAKNDEFFGDLVALHRGNSVRLCAKENQKPSTSTGQTLVRRLGETTRTLSLGEPIEVKVEVDAPPAEPTKHRHAKKHRNDGNDQQVLCALVRLKHFDPRHPSVAFERFRDVYEGTSRADASLSF
jgi:hypothetical protein